MSTVVVASLALGIAANTAIFSFVNAIQFKPLPVEDEATLVDLSETSQTELCAGCAVGTSYPTYRDWKASAVSFESLGAYREQRFVVAASGATGAGFRAGPERLGGAVASPELFPMLGIRPSLGRGFSDADDQPAAEPVVILSHLIWQTRFGGNPNVLGRTVRINGTTRTIIGVMPPGFRFPEFAQLWLPLGSAGQGWPRNDRSLGVVARLRQGVDLQTARAEMRALAAAQAAAYPASHARWTATAVPLRADMTAETVQASIVLLGSVAFVLLIACANVANLLLARALERRRELAIRLSLGATRGHLIRLVLSESLVLSAAGGAVGLLAALWISQLVVTALGTEAPYWIQFGIDWHVFAFCAAVTLLAAVLCGAAPAIQASRPDVNAELRDGGTASASPGPRRLRHVLAVGQLALALVLLACAGLLIKAVARTFQFDTGYDTTKVVVGDLNLEGPAFDSLPSITRLTSALLERLHTHAGVRAAASRTIFFGGFGAEPRRMTVEGMATVPAGASPTFYFAVTDEYFSIVNLPVRTGRVFSRSDPPDVVIVNAALARRVWGERNPLGSRIRFGDAASRAPWLTVIGVTGDSNDSPRAVEPDRPSAYVSFISQPGREFAIYVRSDESGTRLIPEVRAAVAAVDPDLPIEGLMTMEQALAERASPARFVALLMTSLSVIALLLACMGVYGVTAYSIGQRTREIGVRLALGATPGQIQRLVARTGVRMMAAGILVGIAGAWASTRMLEGILFGTSPTDPLVFAAVVTVLAAVAFVASWLPGRKAARIDPIVVLRQVG